MCRGASTPPPPRVRMTHAHRALEVGRPPRAEIPSTGRTRGLRPLKTERKQKNKRTKRGKQK